ASPPKTVLNVNVPNLPLAELRGVQPARLAPFGTVRTTLGETVDGRLQVELRETEEILDPDTDTALVGAGYVAVTSLIGIRVGVDAAGSRQLGGRGPLLVDGAPCVDLGLVLVLVLEFRLRLESGDRLRLESGDRLRLESGDRLRLRLDLRLVEVIVLLDLRCS